MSDLDRALAGDVAHWQGLGGAVGDGELADATGGPRNEPGWARLSGRPVRYRDYPGPALRRAFFDDDDLAFLVWADGPHAVTSTELLERLGEPDERVDQSLSRLGGTEQWVWAARGLTAFVFGSEVAGLALYRPTDVAFYLQYLGGREGPPYRPVPGPG